MPTTLTIRRQVGVLLSVLVIVIVFVSASRIGHLRETEQEFLRATRESAAAFELVNALRLTSVRLQLLGEEIQDDADAESVTALRRLFESIMQEARVEVDNAAGFETLDRDAVTDLDALESMLNASVARRLEYLQATADMRESRASLKVTLDLLQAQLDRLDISFRKTFAANPDPGSTGAGVTLRIRLSALLDRIRPLVTMVEPQLVRPAISAAVPAIGDLLRTASEMGEFPEKSAILEQISKLRLQIGGDDGLQALSDRVVAARAASIEASEDLDAGLRAVNTSLDNIVAATEGRIYAVFDQTARASRRAIRNEVLLSWIVALGLVCAVWVVFHRRISRRIEELSEDVLRIASGDLDAPATVSGTDEIGKMADALEVFRKNARELQRSNEQLSNFTYVASHDLRSPLRAIRDLVEWTIENAGEELSSEVAQNLAIIKDRTERLSQLINGLLTYARADHRETVPEPVDLLQMVKNIGDLVDPSQTFSITYRGPRRITTFASPLQTILLNLVANAIKHHDRESGTINIIGRIYDRKLTIKVQDDGPGIAKAYQEQVFEMFQTLRGPEDPHASGMGLALVRKLAEGMDGTVSISSNPNEKRGTTFILHIPVRLDTDCDTTEDSTLLIGDAA